jgi:hypothetical protein
LRRLLKSVRQDVLQKSPLAFAGLPHSRQVRTRRIMCLPSPKEVVAL